MRVMLVLLIPFLNIVSRWKSSLVPSIEMRPYAVRQYFEQTVAVGPIVNLLLTFDKME